MKAIRATRLGGIFFCMIVAISSGACSRSENADLSALRNGDVSLVAVDVDGELSVRIENDSERDVTLEDVPMIGYGQGGPRLGIVLLRDGKKILPCSSLDPQRYARPATVLAPGQATTRTVSIDLIRKVYCLKPGRYDLLAKFPSGAASPILSPKLTLEIEDRMAEEIRPMP